MSVHFDRFFTGRISLTFEERREKHVSVTGSDYTHTHTRLTALFPELPR